MTNRQPVTANDRFKSGWDGRVAWSTAAAAVLHLVLLMWSPGLPSSGASESRDHDPTMEWVALQSSSADATSYGGPTTLVSGRFPAGDMETLAQLGHEADEDADPAVVATASNAGTEALRDYLRRRTEPGATIVNPADGAGVGWADASTRSGRATAEVMVAPDAEPSSSTRRIDASASTTDDEHGGYGDSMGLDRLSAVEPELAYFAPSPWLLIQNPDEVEVFLQRNFRQANEVRGTVSVALWIDDRGSVEWAEINRSSGLPDVDESALVLFSRIASYRPAREHGVRVPIAVIFSLTLPL